MNVGSRDGAPEGRWVGACEGAFDGDEGTRVGKLLGRVLVGLLVDGDEVTGVKVLGLSEGLTVTGEKVGETVTGVEEGLLEVGSLVMGPSDGAVVTGAENGALELGKKEGTTEELAVTGALDALVVGKKVGLVDAGPGDNVTGALVPTSKKKKIKEINLIYQFNMQRLHS
jgi:hypothetical protein